MCACGCPQVEKKGLLATKESCWSYYVEKCRNNLHVVLAMSPVGETLRSRCRNFPGMVNNTVIDWWVSTLATADAFVSSYTSLNGRPPTLLLPHHRVPACMMLTRSTLTPMQVRAVARAGADQRGRRVPGGGAAAGGAAPADRGAHGHGAPERAHLLHTLPGGCAAASAGSNVGLLAPRVRTLALHGNFAKEGYRGNSVATGLEVELLVPGPYRRSCGATTT